MIPKKVRRKRSDALPPEERKRRQYEANERWQNAHPESVRRYQLNWRKAHREWKARYIAKNRERIRYNERIRQKAKLRQRKQQLVDNAGGACCKCGYNRCLAALEFHHREKVHKKFEVSARNILALAERDIHLLFEESAKCDLLCANCHRENHYPN